MMPRIFTVLWPIADPSPRRCSETTTQFSTFGVATDSCGASRSRGFHACVRRDTPRVCRALLLGGRASITVQQNEKLYPYRILFCFVFCFVNTGIRTRITSCKRVRGGCPIFPLRHFYFRMQQTNHVDVQRRFRKMVILCVLLRQCAF